MSHLWLINIARRLFGHGQSYPISSCPACAAAASRPMRLCPPFSRAGRMLSLDAMLRRPVMHQSRDQPVA
jgi:hypothetical protein